MSKRKLDFFKWNPLIWNSGDIQMCSYDAKGIFCDIKADYWIKECIMSYEFLLKQWDKPEEHRLIKELIDRKVIKIKRGMVIIEFMMEQRSEITGTSKKNSVNGKKGAEKRWNKVDAELKPHTVKAFDYKALIEKPTWLDTMCIKHKLKTRESLKEWLQKFEVHLPTIGESHSTEKEYIRHFNNWMAKQTVSEDHPYTKEQIRQAKSLKESTGNVPEWFDKKYISILK